ncbi:MAG TPA: TRAP transporter small permease [Usitatibacter sp.]|nr:TRAP transporter small permease [Usitatibacter sp.]
MRWLERLEETLIAALLAAMTLVAFAQVIARYAFNYSFTSALELTTTLFAGLIFLGIPYGVRVGSHIGMEALVRALEPRAARVVGAVAAALCFAYAAILLAGSWQYVSKMYELQIDMEDLPIPQWMPRAILLVSFALLLLRFGQAFVRIVRGDNAGLALADEAADVVRQSRGAERSD